MLLLCNNKNDIRNNHSFDVVPVLEVEFYHW